MLGPAVAIEHLLVILRAREKRVGAAIHQRVDGTFLPLQKFLDHDAPPGLAELPLLHHPVNRLRRLFRGVGDDHAFAERQPVRLDHDRVSHALAEPVRLRAVGEFAEPRRRECRGAP